MSNATVIPSIDQLTATARAKTVAVLKGLDVYKAMSVADQKAIYLDMVDENLDKEKRNMD